MPCRAAPCSGEGLAGPRGAPGARQPAGDPPPRPAVGARGSDRRWTAPARARPAASTNRPPRSAPPAAFAPWTSPRAPRRWRGASAGAAPRTAPRCWTGSKWRTTRSAPGRPRWESCSVSAGSARGGPILRGAAESLRAASGQVRSAGPTWARAARRGLRFHAQPRERRFGAGGGGGTRAGVEGFFPPPPPTAQS